MPAIEVPMQLSFFSGFNTKALRNRSPELESCFTATCCKMKRLSSITGSSRILISVLPWLREFQFTKRHLNNLKSIAEAVDSWQLQESWCNCICNLSCRLLHYSGMTQLWQSVPLTG